MGADSAPPPLLKSLTMLSVSQVPHPEEQRAALQAQPTGGPCNQGITSHQSPAGSLRAMGNGKVSSCVAQGKP